MDLTHYSTVPHSDPSHVDTVLCLHRVRICIYLGLCPVEIESGVTHVLYNMRVSVPLCAEHHNITTLSHYNWQPPATVKFLQTRVLSCAGETGDSDVFIRLEIPPLLHVTY